MSPEGIGWTISRYETVDATMDDRFVIEAKRLGGRIERVAGPGRRTAGILLCKTCYNGPSQGRGTPM